MTRLHVLCCVVHAATLRAGNPAKATVTVSGEENSLLICDELASSLCGTDAAEISSIVRGEAL